MAPCKLRKLCSISIFYMAIHVLFYYTHRLDPNFCVCSNTLGVSVDPSILTFQRTRHNIRISQHTSGIYTHSNFEFLLTNIRFAHDPVRPPVDQYAAYVLVTASDGQLRSEVATTRIDVSISNVAPTVLFGGQTNTSVEMVDGQARISVLASGQLITVFEDTSVITSVSIILTNPSHSNEQITISIPNLPAGITVINNGGSSIILAGPASPVDFSQVLTDATLYYNYPPMESILQGEVPDLTTR